MTAQHLDHGSPALHGAAPRRVLYVLAPPLIWLASLAVPVLIGLRACASPGAVLAVQMVALIACMALMYRALKQVRAPATAGRDTERLWHFIAGGSAALSMAAIGATAFLAQFAARC